MYGLGFHCQLEQERIKFITQKQVDRQKKKHTKEKTCSTRKKDHLIIPVIHRSKITLSASQRKRMEEEKHREGQRDITKTEKYLKEEGRRKKEKVYECE